MVHALHRRIGQKVGQKVNFDALEFGAEHRRLPAQSHICPLSVTPFQVIYDTGLNTTNHQFGSKSTTFQDDPQLLPSQVLNFVWTMSERGPEGDDGRNNSTCSSVPMYQIDHGTKMLDCLKDFLFLNDEHADVHLIVQGVRLPAHKIILAARSGYFRALLFGGLKETWQEEIELEGVSSSAAFKVVLEYVYHGRLSLGEMEEDVILDVLGLCHKYGFEDLEASICKYLEESLHLGNICQILDTALVHGLHSLVGSCCTFGDTNAEPLLQHESFFDLSPAGVTKLLSRDTFYAQEDKIFNRLAAWVELNKDIHQDASSVLENVRLRLIKIGTLLNVVRPTELVNGNEIVDAIKFQMTAPASELQYRGNLILDENVANWKDGALVLGNGYRVDQFFSGCLHLGGYLMDGRKHDRGTIKLGRQYILNHIRVQFCEDDGPFPYYMDVSIDGQNWVRICDFSKYHCQSRSWQDIFFSQRAIRFIKVILIDDTTTTRKMIKVQAFYTDKEFSNCSKFGLLCPKQNVATIKLDARVIEGKGPSANALIDGEMKRYDRNSGFTYHNFGRGAIVVQLAQPYVIGWMKLLLWDCDDREQGYKIEVSTDKSGWDVVWDKSGEKCKSWQIIKFDPLPVVYVRIVGTKCGTFSLNRKFRCVHLDCRAEAPNGR